MSRVVYNVCDDQYRNPLVFRAQTGVRELLLSNKQAKLRTDVTDSYSAAMVLAKNAVEKAST